MRGYVETITPFLESEKSIHRWTVDTKSLDKVLSVSGEDVDPQLQVMGAGETNL